MNLNYKLYFKYILFQSNHIFFKNFFKNDKNLNLFINQKNLYYVTLHLKLSSLFYSTQLIDMFAYETPTNKNYKIEKTSLIPLISNNVIVYNFHSVSFQQRFFIFVENNTHYSINKNIINWSSLNSITELFLNANWLEREIAELHGVFFTGKKDLRNLMLPYGDVSAPMRKSYPSIGTREIFYDTVTDLLIQNPVSIQF